MDARLTEFADIAKFFMTKADSITECLEEARKTQEMLARIILLQRELEGIYKKAEREFTEFCCDKRDSIFTILNKNGVKTSHQIIDDKLVRLNPVVYNELKEKVDTAKLDYECAEAFKMAYFQRKDIIAEVISCWKIKHEMQSCILNNKEFVKKILG